MAEKKYIVTKSQILNGVIWSLEQVFNNPTIVKEIMVLVENELETILEDDCDEYSTD